ncbi:SRPBCC family protein [Streptomyces sp. NPDC093093]|uniref:aromatase/cyclase n=1 Tax=Streptomyces sp. NPDC093093 TaxID=3366025 RepID=UPI003809D508
MSVERVHRMTHAVDAAAPAGVLYALVADTAQWPLLVPDTVHVEPWDFDGSRERFSLWDTRDGTVRTSLWRRTLDSERRRIDFRQEVPEAPVTSAGGSWTVRQLAPGWSRLTLEQDFTVAGNRGSDVERARADAERGGRIMLDRLREAAERWEGLDALTMSFEDSVRFDGPGEPVGAFLYDVASWPGRVPHIARADVVEDRPGVQRATTHTLTVDGSVHTTESVRVSFPAAARTVYKETVPSPLLAAHTGEWSIVPDETGVTVLSLHHVLLDERMVERVLGPDADLSQARRYVRETLGRESAATFEQARAYARNAVRGLRAL